MSAAFLASAAFPQLALAQDTGEEQPEPREAAADTANADAPDATERGGATIYTPEDF